MQTVGLFQTFENYLFLRRLTCTAQESVGGAEPGQGRLLAWRWRQRCSLAPGDSRHGRTGEGEGCVIRGGCLSRWRGLATLSTLESWIRLYALIRRLERLWRAHSDARRRQQTHGCVRTREGNVVEPTVHVVVVPPLVLLLVEGLFLLFCFFLHPLLQACHTCAV